MPRRRMVPARLARTSLRFPGRYALPDWRGRSFGALPLQEIHQPPGGSASSSSSGEMIHS